MTFAKPLVSPTILTILLVAIIATQYRYDVQKRERPPVPPTIIPAQAIKISDLGLHSAVASLMWVYTIQQVTERPDKLFKLIENVNMTDPKFSYPYAFAALVLPDITGSPEKAIGLAERGIKDADPDWRIPYYLATTYHIFFQNREKAAFYFDLAANTPGALDKIKNIAYFYGTAPNIREQTRQIWLSIYENTNDELVREKAQNYLVQIELLNALDKAVLFYKQKYGKYPQTMEDLVIRKIIKEVPVSPLGLKFLIDNGRVVVR